MTSEILIVDDQPGIRLLLEDLLTDHGFRVATASTGKEALEKLEEHSFDLIVLDYKIPIINGAGVLTKMKQRNQSTPVIVMSGLIEQYKNELVNFSNVKTLIAKPFNIEEIPLIIKQILDDCA